MRPISRTRDRRRRLVLPMPPLLFLTTDRARIVPSETPKIGQVNQHQVTMRDISRKQNTKVPFRVDWGEAITKSLDLLIVTNEKGRGRQGTYQARAKPTTHRQTRKLSGRQQMHYRVYHATVYSLRFDGPRYALSEI